MGGTVVAPGGHGICGAAAVDDVPFAVVVPVLVVAPPGVVAPGVVAPVVGAPGVVDPGAVVAFGVDGDCVVLVVPALLVLVPVPAPVFLGCVVVPVPAPAGMHGGDATGEGVVDGVVCVVPGVGVTVPCGVGVVVPDGVGVVVPDGVGATVPDGVGAVVGLLCAAMPMTDIVAANANAHVRIVSLRCIAQLLFLFVSFMGR